MQYFSFVAQEILNLKSNDALKSALGPAHQAHLGLWVNSVSLLEKEYIRVALEHPQPIGDILPSALRSEFVHTRIRDTVKGFKDAFSAASSQSDANMKQFVAFSYLLYLMFLESVYEAVFVAARDNADGSPLTAEDLPLDKSSQKALSSYAQYLQQLNPMDLLGKRPTASHCVCLGAVVDRLLTSLGAEPAWQEYVG